MSNRSYLHGVDKETWQNVYLVLNSKAQAYMLTCKQETLDHWDLDLMIRSHCEEYKPEYRKPRPEMVCYHTAKYSENPDPELKKIEEAVDLILEDIGNLHYGSR